MPQGSTNSGKRRGKGGSWFAGLALIGALPVVLIALQELRFSRNKGAVVPPPTRSASMSQPVSHREQASSVQPRPVASDLNSPSLQPTPGRDLLSILGAVQVEGAYLVVSPPKASSEAGFRAGDRITKINYRHVTEPIRDLRVLEASAETGVAELEVWRGADKLMINLPAT